MTERLLTPEHRSVINMVGHALTLQNDLDVWHGLTLVLQARLSRFERGCLAAVVLDSVDDDPFWAILEALVPARCAGQPLPSFLDIEAEARWWADIASPVERRAWLTACFLRLPARDQKGFLAASKRRAAA